MPERARRRSTTTNLKVNEFLYRRVDIEDVVSAHLLALDKAPEIGFGKFIISATTPFTREDAAELGRDAPRGAARGACRSTPPSTRARGWKMLPTLDRVYVNERAREGAGLAAAVRFPARVARRGRGRGFAQPARAQQSARRAITAQPEASRSTD